METKSKEEDERLVFDQEYIDKTLKENYDPRYKQSIVKHPFPYVSGYKNEWWCELEYRPKLSQYYKHMSTLHQETGKRGPKRDLYCYVKFPHMRYLQFIGFMAMDEKMFSMFGDNRIYTLLPEDFKYYFVPLPDFSDIVENFDDVERVKAVNGTVRRNIYTDDEKFRAEIREFTYGSDIDKMTDEFYTYWKTCTFIDKNVDLPTPLTLASLYADVKPPYECSNLFEWRGFKLEEPSKSLPIVSEILKTSESQGRQFVVISPKSLAERIVSMLREGKPASFSELFREEYEVTCIPFDLDVTGPIARRCWNDRKEENDYIDKWVKELRFRLNWELREFLQDDFDIGRWPMGIFRRRIQQPDKLSFHLYQMMPSNVSFKSIEHVRVLVNKMIEEMKDRYILVCPNSGTFLGHWECVVDGATYETKPDVMHHGKFYGPDGKELTRHERLKAKFVPYIDSQIYKVNGSLRLPGCSKSTNVDDVMVRADDDAEVDESDIVNSLVHLPHRCKDNVIGALRRFPQHCIPSQQKQVRIEYPEAERSSGSFESPLELNNGDVQRLREFIEKEYETTVTKCKRMECALFFDTTLTFCPFANKDHENAKQYFIYRGRESSTLLRKCWHSQCQGKYKIKTFQLSSEVMTIADPST